MTRNSVFAASLLAMGIMAGTSATAQTGHHNPVDRVSNPKALDYKDVSRAPRNLDEPFIRDGVVTEPQRFQAITPGLEQAQVQTALGTPVRKYKSEWDYNFKMKMPQSENYLVCQYKLVFDKEKRVEAGVWRRQQCQKLANGEAL